MLCLVKDSLNGTIVIILNIDGSCLDLPVRAGYGRIIRNSVGYYLLGFLGYIQESFDTLYAELFAIYQVSY